MLNTVTRRAASICKTSSCKSSLVKLRQYACTSSTQSAAGISNDNYVSPLAPFFNEIKASRTSSGLSKSEPIIPPSKLLKCGVEEDALSFKAVHYTPSALPPYVQPGEFKVTLKVSLDDIPLKNETEREMLLQLVGNRYHKRTNRLMLTSDKFPNRIENKRYLVDLFDRLVIAAKRLASEGDSYYDSMVENKQGKNDL